LRGRRLLSLGDGMKPRISDGGQGRLVRGLWLIQLALWLGAGAGLAQESNAPAPVTGAAVEETNTPGAAPAIAELERQLRASQAALEQSTREAREAAARNEATLARGLKTIEETMAAQREVFAQRGARELEVVQNSNRMTLLIGGLFAAVVSLGMVLIVWFQWRMSKVWGGISAALPLARGVAAADPQAAFVGAVTESNRRLLGALGRLEQRLQLLEVHSAPAPALAAPPAAAGKPVATGNNGAASEPRDYPPTAGASPLPAGNAIERLEELLAQGRAMLRENRWEAAIMRFDEVLSLDAGHGEALVKKGAALERLRKFNDAIACYDRAIAADPKMTLAYVHKSGLCNRLERFKEALECYEKALRTHEERLRV
jgi:tetratricopeptide (TPR) repeat protein